MVDTICAISTSLGVGAISIIRMSGPEAINIINSIFKGPEITPQKNRTINYGKIFYNDELIDEVLISVMYGPKSYTCEDIVEINCHGGIATTKKILDILLQKGCRLAEKGEFTKRAFLNGRIDLTEAESVNELLLAETDNKRKLALNKINGLLYKKINSVRNILGDLLSNIEVNIDFPEYEDNLVITENIVDERIKNVLKELYQILDNSKQNEIVTSGINVALIGSPNVGKSSLLNAFLDEEKAIVTDIAGTTRDIVEGKCYLNDIEINFIDTAGIRETDDLVEKIGVEKSKKVIDLAALVILLFDGSRELTKEEHELLNSMNNEKTIIFVNKNDLEQKIMLDTEIPVVYGNTKSLNGIKTLKEKIIEMFNLDKIIIDEKSLTSNVRQENLIKESLNKLEDVLKNVKVMPVDMLAIDIKIAWDLLGEITGESYQDELIDLLFKNFCLGK